jgi:hypothetical protein
MTTLKKAQEKARENCKQMKEEGRDMDYYHLPEDVFMDVIATTYINLLDSIEAGMGGEYTEGYKQGQFDAEVTAEYGEPEALQDNK